MTPQPRPQEGDRHPHSEEPDASPAGSGTTTGESAEKRQAGSYGRDAEQDPAGAPESET